MEDEASDGQGAEISWTVCIFTGSLNTYCGRERGAKIIEVQRWLCILETNLSCKNRDKIWLFWGGSLRRKEVLGMFILVTLTFTSYCTVLMLLIPSSNI